MKNQQRLKKRESQLKITTSWLNYLRKIRKNLALNHIKFETATLEHQETINCASYLSFKFVTPWEVHEEIRKTKTKRSAGPDGIQASFLKR